MKPWLYMKSLGLVAILLAVLAGCSSQTKVPTEKAPEKQPAKTEVKSLTIASGPVGGSWYPVMAAVGEIIKNELGIPVTVDIGGSVENVKRVNTGRDADMGIAFSNTVYDGYVGNYPFKEKQSNIALIAFTYTSAFQTAATEASKITKWTDLKGKRFAPGKVGWGGEVLSQIVLKEYGLSYDTIRQSGGAISFMGFQEAVEAMKDGLLDAHALMSTVPVPAFEDLTLTHKVTFIGIDKEVIDRILKQYPGYMVYELPANTYKGQGTPVLTLGAGNVIFVRKDLPEEIVYKITKAIFKKENETRIKSTLKPVEKEFGLTNALNWKQIPLHPGAEKFYKEVGMLK